MMKRINEPGADRHDSANSIARLSTLLPERPASTWRGDSERMAELELAADYLDGFPDLAASLIRRELSVSQAEEAWSSRLSDDTEYTELPSYEVVVIDPPWLDDRRVCRLREDDYFPLSFEQLRDLHLPMADHCHVWLWSPASHFKQAIELLEGWGCQYQAVHVWPAPSHEWSDRAREGDLAVYGRRGSPMMFDASTLGSNLPVRASSERAKPAEFFEMIKQATRGMGRTLCLSPQEVRGFDATDLGHLRVRDVVEHLPDISVPCDPDLGRRLSGLAIA